MRRRRNLRDDRVAVRLVQATMRESVTAHSQGSSHFRLMWILERPAISGEDQPSARAHQQADHVAVDLDTACRGAPAGWNLNWPRVGGRGATDGNVSTDGMTAACGAVTRVSGRRVLLGQPSMLVPITYEGQRRSRETTMATRMGGHFPWFHGVFVERAMGLEPTTACLGSRYSTN